MHDTAPADRGEDEAGRASREAPALRLAVGVRVRVIVEGHATRVVPEGDDERGEGVAALLLPLDADDDLRTLFARPRRNDR